MARRSCIGCPWCDEVALSNELGMQKRGKTTLICNYRGYPGALKKPPDWCFYSMEGRRMLQDDRT